MADTYNFPGGALGVLESEPISLANVSTADAPQFYFTYYSTVEDVLTNDLVAQDVLRVRVMGDDGVWRSVAVNNERLPRGVGDPLQNIYNNDATQTSWRQARINLTPFVGNSELRFRFEFSTGDGLGSTRGAEMRAIAANQLRDGQTFVVNNRTFELELGPTVVVPAGDLITNNTTVQIAGSTFAFYNGVGAQPAGFIVPYSRTQSAAEVTNALALAINQAVLPNGTGGIVGAIATAGGVQISGGIGVTVNGNLRVDGAVGVGAGRTAVPLQINMNADAVATAIQTTLSSALAGGSNVYPRNGDLVTLTGVTVNNPGPFTVTSQSANNFERGRDNDFEGIYLDDFIIGFAERGEIVFDPNTGANVDTTFVPNPLRSAGSAQVGEQIANSINVGPYQLEIRGGEEYLIPVPNTILVPPGELSPILQSFNPLDLNNLPYTQAFGVNERLSTGAVLTLTGSENLVDGDYLDISDGVRTLRFVFKNTAVGTTLGANEIAVPFTSLVRDAVTGVSRPESATTIASRLRDIINSPNVQSQLSLTAISINGATSGLGGPSIALSSNSVVSIANVSPRAPIATSVVNKKRGDVNTRRDQGQIVIENSRISSSAEFGIRLRADDRDAVSNNPNPGSVRNTVVLNNERLAPGAVIINNELIENVAGGIQIVGDTGANTASAAAVPFARIINNTILGGSLSQPTSVNSAIFRDVLFTQGTIAFADRIPVGGYTPNFSVDRSRISVSTNLPMPLVFQTSREPMGLNPVPDKVPFRSVTVVAW